MLEAAEARFGEWVDADDRRAIALRALQRRQHPRMVRPRILPGDEDRLRLIEVLQRHSPFADADRLHERRAARLMAHVRAIGKVVRDELPYEQLIEKGGFVGRSPGGVE